VVVNFFQDDRTVGQSEPPATCRYDLTPDRDEIFQQNRGAKIEEEIYVHLSGN